MEIMDAVHDNKIKGMYILGENPAMSDPDVEHARDALAQLEHLVVQDIFITETANYADVILPAAAFAEKSGTVTNTNQFFPLFIASIDSSQQYYSLTLNEILNRLDMGLSGDI